MNLCNCGCGKELIQTNKYYTKKFIYGHSNRGKNNPNFGKYNPNSGFAKKGTKESIEAKLNKSIAQKKKWKNKEYREKLFKSHNWEKKELKCLFCSKIEFVNPGLIKKRKFCSRSCSSKYFWTQSQYIDKVLNKNINNPKFYNTKPERCMKQILEVANIPYIHQKKFGRYIYDFYLFQHDLIIEVDGTYWHSSEKAKQHDSIKDKNIIKRKSEIYIIEDEVIKRKENNLKILRFTDKEIYNNSHEVYKKIMLEIGGCPF